MTVSAVVVTYNRLDMLKEVIEALKSGTLVPDHIIVVDNNSRQDTVDYLTGLGNQIEYLRLQENLGGAGGFNKGVRYFMENTKDDYVWLMDDDTIPHDNTLQELVQFANEIQEFGFLASDVRWIDGSRAKMNNPAPKNHLKKISEDATNPEELMNATFVSLLMKREVIFQIGLPITDFFIWGDDIEFTERAARIASGYFVPSAKVTHKMATNVGSNIMNDTLDRLPRYFYSYRNKIYYGSKRNFLGHIKSNVRILLEAFRLLVMPGVDNRYKRITVLMQGVHAGLSFNPDIEYIK